MLQGFVYERCLTSKMMSDVTRWLIREPLEILSRFYSLRVFVEMPWTCADRFCLCSLHLAANAVKIIEWRDYLLRNYLWLGLLLAVVLGACSLHHTTGSRVLQEPHRGAVAPTGRDSFNNRPPNKTCGLIKRIIRLDAYCLRCWRQPGLELFNIVWMNWLSWRWRRWEYSSFVTWVWNFLSSCVSYISNRREEKFV